jgi:CPA1 family monovalent cation:H+ antiporter
MKEFWEATIAVKKIGLAAERSVAERWLKEHKASTRAAELFLSSLDRVEMLLASRYKIKLLMRTLWQNLKRLLTNNEPKEVPMSPDHPDWDQYKALKLEAIRAAIGEIQTVKPAEKKEILQAVIADYRAMEHFLQNDRVWSRRKQKLSSERMELELKAIQSERNEIQSMFEQGDIDRTQTSQLRMDVNYREANLFESQALVEDEGH